MFRIELRSEIDGVVERVHKQNGQWCFAADTLITIRSGAKHFALCAPAIGEVCKIWVENGQFVAAGECLVTFDCPD